MEAARVHGFQPNLELVERVIFDFRIFFPAIFFIVLDTCDMLISF